jgi:hypothetical protein
MGRGYRVFIVERNFITTSEAADKVRAQRIKGSGFWRSGNQEPRKGKEGGGVYEGCEVDKIRMGDKKSGSTSHDPRCKRRRSGVKDCLKQRPMSRNLELRGSITYRPCQHNWRH